MHGPQVLERSLQTKTGKGTWLPKIQRYQLSLPGQTRMENSSQRGIVVDKANKEQVFKRQDLL